MNTLATEPESNARPSPVAKLLDARPWGHCTRTFDALGYCFAVRTTDPALGVYVGELFDSLPQGPASAPTHVYSVVQRERHDARSFSVFFDGHRFARIGAASQLVRTLMWHVNREVAERSDRLLFHASAVSRDGQAVMFVAPMESGKSTIATALVRDGLEFVTDEVVSFDRDGLVHPFPRPVGLERGSWALFPDLRPTLSADVVQYSAAQWLLPPLAIGATISEPCHIALIVKLSYDPTRPTTVTPLHRSRMIPHLIDQSFNFHRIGPSALRQVAAIVSDAECVELVMNDLGDAQAKIITRLDLARAKEGRS